MEEENENTESSLHILNYIDVIAAVSILHDFGYRLTDRINHTFDYTYLYDQKDPLYKEFQNSIAILLEYINDNRPVYIYIQSC